MLLAAAAVSPLPVVLVAGPGPRGPQGAVADFRRLRTAFLFPDCSLGQPSGANSVGRGIRVLKRQVHNKPSSQGSGWRFPKPVAFSELLRRVHESQRGRVRPGNHETGH